MIEYNIIKQFKDDDYKTYLKYSWDSPTKEFYWGLSDDGKLFYKIIDLNYDSYWISYNHCSINFNFTLKIICKICKEFGHLLVFI